MAQELPPCGIYRTLAPIGSIPEGRLVYFHNHGKPGPGMYLPEKWLGNRAVFSTQGHLLPKPDDAANLVPLPPEGFYRVEGTFHCCEKKCREYTADLLVQLGYDGAGSPILFDPMWDAGKLTLPDRGTRIDFEALLKLAPLRIDVKKGSEGSDTFIH